MTVAAGTNRFPYTGNGATTSFPFTGRIFNASDILVFVNGSLTVVGFTTTFSLIAPYGGNVVFTTAPANGVSILLLRSTPRSQQIDWIENNADPAQAKEDASDRLTNIVQEIDEVVSRALKFPVASTLSPTVPVPAAGDVGKFLSILDILGNFGYATSVPAGSLNNPVSMAQGGTGANYASRAALLQGLGIPPQGDPATGLFGSFGVTAGVVQVPNPLTNNATFINNNLSGITNAGLVGGTRIVLYYSSIVTLTHSFNFFLLGAKDATVAVDTISIFQLSSVGGGWIEVDRFILGNATNRFQFWRGDGTYQMPPMPEAGRLVFISGTSIKFNPFKGRLLPVKAGGSWQQRDIGSGGISSGNPTTASNFVNGVAAQVLAANTTYLVTVFDNAGALTFDFLTVLTHTQDAATGVEIKNGDDSRTVVGMVKTDATPNFTDFFTKSWFNRLLKTQQTNFSADRAVTNVNYTEFNTEVRNNFLLWSGEVVQISCMGSSALSAVGNALIGIATDDAIADPGLQQGQSILGAGSFGIVSISGFKPNLGEGLHFATLVGKSDVGTLTVHGIDGAIKAGVGLHVGIQG